MQKISPLVFRDEHNFDQETHRCYVGTVYDPIVDKLNEVIKKLNSSGLITTKEHLDRVLDLKGHRGLFTKEPPIHLSNIDIDEIEDMLSATGTFY
jgi:hypothetical protein